MRRTICILIGFLLAVTCFITHASAQYPFGKNKIQYAPKDWKIIETPHAEIFYYPQESSIADYIASRFEYLYREYAEFFDVEFDRRIPIILYGTHHDFKETNVIPYFISEGTGGFTEFIKGRVALPFVGSYGNLYAIFRHEMVHAFMLEKLRIVMKDRRRFTYNHPPLWFTEGLAEFLAHRGQDTEAHMFMRDAITNNIFFPLGELWKIQGTYLMYKEGESALHYIATRFGDRAVKKILENWWMSDKFGIVLEKTIGLDVDELSRDWEEYLKRRYYPAVLNRRRAREIAEPMHRKIRSFENHPVCVTGNDGEERYFCTGFGQGSIDLFELKQRKDGEWERKTVIRGARSTDFESIPLLRSRISAKGDTLVFVAKVGERDAVYFYDVTASKVRRRIFFDKARILNSPNLSPDGSLLAFSAIDDHGKADLYLFDCKTENFTRLTDDYYHDVHPDWHPMNRRLVFSSDRCAGGNEERYALYTIDVETREIRALTGGEHRDSDPRHLPDGSGILFSSDRDGFFDIFLLEGDSITRQTNVLGGAFDPSPCSGGKAFLMSVYSDGTYHVYRSPLKEGRSSFRRSLVENAHSEWLSRSPDSSAVFKIKDYNLKFGLDFIGAAFAVDPDFGYMGNGAQLFFTDILGNHQLLVLFGSASDDFNDFWRNLNFAVTYVNQSNRLNYAFGAFHLASYMGTFRDLLRFERRFGGLGWISYPFSKFTRVDFSSVFKWMERDDDITFLGLEKGRSLLLTNYLSFTTDNIVWYVGGPLSGHRLNIAVGNSIDLQGSRYESSTLHFDIRNYINLTDRLVFAQRFVSRNAWGSDLQLFYLGGSWDLRGYDFREFAGKSILLLNNELRFPLLDRLLVRFPFGHIDFPLFRGSLFFDIGSARRFYSNTGLLGSFGTGVEMNLGYLPVIRVNFSRLTDFETVEKDLKIDFFIGFNY
jgi:hypothetical protein